MQELVSNVLTAPLGTIFVLAGVLFLFLGVVGKISGRIETGPRARLLSGVLGAAFITIGLTLSWWSLPAPPPGPSSPIASNDTAKKSPEKDTATPSPPRPVSISSDSKDVPDWVPLYPVGKVENLSIRVGDEGRKSGSFSFTTQDSQEGVLNFYAGILEAKKWKVNRTQYIVTATSVSGGQSITVATAFISRTYTVSFSESVT